MSNARFLGTGWAFPPGFTKSGADVEMVSGHDDIQQSLQILLATTRGQHVMQEQFGCALNDLLFEEVDHSLVNRINSLVSVAILAHEPRIRVDRLDVSPDPLRRGLLHIAIEYTVRSTNSRYNMVYPFYINEAAPPRP